MTFCKYCDIEKCFNYHHQTATKFKCDFFAKLGSVLGQAKLTKTHLTSYPTSSSPSKPPCQLFINTCSVQQCAQTFPIKVIPGDSVGLFEILVIFGILTKWCHSSISDEGDTQIQTNISLHDLDNVSSHGGAY